MHRIPEQGDRIYRIIDGMFLGTVKHITNPFMFLETETHQVKQGRMSFYTRKFSKKQGLAIFNWHNGGHLNPDYEIRERTK